MWNDLGAVVRRSPMIRLFTVGFLSLLLQIPIFMISGLISERQQRRDEAVKEVSSKWGNTQNLTGPALIVPYVRRWTTIEDGKTVTHEEHGSPAFLPEQLRITGKMIPEIRRRGIFSIPVYVLAMDVEGKFGALNWEALGLDPSYAQWKEAYLAVSISDTRAIQEMSDLNWGGGKASFLPGSMQFHSGTPGVHAEVGAPPAGDGAFSFSARLNGTEGIYFSPFGKQTEVRLESSWQSPSFKGNWIPSKRDVSEKGFVADWSIPFLGRDFPQEWRDANAFTAQADQARFGLDLMQTVDSYRMADRSVKYAILFLLLTLGSVWLAEVMARILVHPIQYCLLGAALCMFYLLELALSEHLGFTAAYLLATVAVVGMVGLYAKVVLRGMKGAAILAGGVAALYGYLYVVLTNEDYALLVGAIGLFLLLAAVMFVTRRVDWFRVEGPRNEVRPAA